MLSSSPRTVFLVAVLAMAAVVALSNVLVQFPIDAQWGDVYLGDLLTWGAFTYPIAFLVTDSTNRAFGPGRARQVVLVGFAVAVVLSIFLATPRIAIASGTAFLVAHLLDVSVFDRLRKGPWWQAPLISSSFATALDTLLFFSIAFAPAFAGIDALFGAEDNSLGFGAPFLGMGTEVPLWLSLAAGDYLVKAAVALVLLVPYRAVRNRIADRELASA